MVVLKKTYGLQAGIDISYSIDAPDNLPVTELDICTLLCNMLDNGIEAASQCPSGSGFLKLQIRSNNGYFFGVELIRSITEKYDGHLSINQDSPNTVRVIAALFLNPQ